MMLLIQVPKIVKLGDTQQNVVGGLRTELTFAEYSVRSHIQNSNYKVKAAICLQFLTQTV